MDSDGTTLTGVMVLPFWVRTGGPGTPAPSPDNSAPVANDQLITTGNQTPIDIALTASDPDGDPLTYSRVANPTHGTLSGTEPNLTYTPNPNFSGSDSFTFQVNDGTTHSNLATVSITVNNGAAVTVESVSAVEGVGLLFTVTLDGAVQGGTNVSVTLADVSATGGAAPLVNPEDYDNVVADLSFTGTAGETRQFTVATLDDALLEVAERFKVHLNADNQLVTDTDTATGTITDNDGAAVTVESVSAVEGEGLLFTVTLDDAVQGGVDVSVTLADVSATGGAAPLVSPEDYDNVVADLSFAGTAGETRQFTVATLDDALLEGAETFTVNLNADNPLVTDTDTATGTIRADTIRVGNQAPILESIGNQTMHHADGSLTVSLNASDPDGDSLTYSAAQAVDPVAQLAYDLDQQLGFFAGPTIKAKNYYENLRGAGEKYFKGQGGKWYFILPNAELHRWGGSIQGSPLVATLAAGYYDDPASLHDVVLSGPVPVALSLDPQNATLTISPDSGYVGSFHVQVTATDGTNSVDQTFSVNVTNQAATLDPISDQQMSHLADSLQVTFATNNPDNDPLVYSVDAVYRVANEAYALDQQLGLYADSTILAKNYYENLRGAGEKYFKGQGGQWYFILPNAELHRWGGSIQGSPLVATLDPSHYDDPATLYGATPPTWKPVSAAVSGSTLTINPPHGMVGVIHATLTVSDGIDSHNQSFSITVGPNDASGPI